MQMKLDSPRLQTPRIPGSARGHAARNYVSHTAKRYSRAASDNFWLDAVCNVARASSFPDRQAAGNRREPVKHRREREPDNLI